MNFLWPELLVLAAVLPLLVLLYLWLLRRRKQTVLRHPHLAMVKEAMGRGHSWRRHLPPALMLCALAALVVASARPTTVITLPSQQQTIMLVMDVSISMAAKDVSPDRMFASQDAARNFVAALPSNARIGVVAYGGSAHLVQPPTRSREDVISAIDRFQLQRGTAIGSGIVIALDTLFPEAGIDLSRISSQRPMARGSFGASGQDDFVGLKAVPPGSYESAALVLLTDGQNTAGVDPMDAAQMAANRGVKIYAVGFGSREGATLSFGGWSVHVRLDEETLRNIANLTSGQYFHAASGADLQQVYRSLTGRLVIETKETEVTAIFAAVAALLLVLAAGLSIWWFGRVK